MSFTRTQPFHFVWDFNPPDLTHVGTHPTFLSGSGGQATTPLPPGPASPPGPMRCGLEASLAYPYGAGEGVGLSFVWFRATRCTGLGACHEWSPIGL